MAGKTGCVTSYNFYDKIATGNTEKHYRNMNRLLLPVYAGCINIVIFHWLRGKMNGCDEQELNEKTIYQILLNTFPKQNDFFECDYVEELQELHHFGINTKDKLNELLVRHMD